MIELKNYCRPSFSSRWSLEDDTLLYYMEPKYVLILDYCCGALNIIELTEKEINESYNYEDFESFLETLEDKYGFRLKDCNWMTTESLSIYRYKDGKKLQMFNNRVYSNDIRLQQNKQNQNEHYTGEWC